MQHITFWQRVRNPLCTLAMTLCWLALAVTGAQAQEVEHVMTIGGTDEVYAVDIAVDNADNLYVAGNFWGETDFGADTLTPDDLSDIYLAKVDPQGNPLWTQHIGGEHEEEATSIAVDNDGNVYITGTFYKTISFGTVTFSTIPNAYDDAIDDAFIAKYDTNGNFIWAKHLEGGDAYVDTHSLAVDDEGSAYLVGVFYETIDLGVEIFTSGHRTDAFIVKYDTNGTPLWADHASGPYIQRFSAVAEHDGKVYVIGAFGESIDFGSKSLTGQGLFDSDIVFAIYTSDGTLTRLSGYGTKDTDVANDVAVDHDGNVLITGYFLETAQFGPITLTSSGRSDGYVAKFSDNGTPLWVQPFGGDNLITVGQTLTTDSNDNIYVGGVLEQGTVHFGALELTVEGNNFFVASYDKDGNATWVRQATTPQTIAVNALARTSNGRLYAAGDYQVSAYLGSFTIVANQFYHEGFVARWGPPQDDLIFSNSFEAWNFADWTNYSGDHGDLSITRQAALAAGERGLQALLDDNTPIGVRDELPASEPRYLVRFRFDPNSISMAQDENHVIFFGYSGHDLRRPVLRLEVRNRDGIYQLRAAIFDDGTTWRTSGWRAIEDEQTRIALEWYAATGEGADDGSLHLRINDRTVSLITGVDNDTRRIDIIRLGAIAGIDDGTRGTTYFDAFESRRLTYLEPNQLVTAALTNEITAWTEVDESDPAEAALMQEVLAFAEQVEREEALEETPPTEQEQSPQLYLPSINRP